MPDDPITRPTDLSLARYAPGWGHPPGVLERAIREGESQVLKTTTHPDTGASYASVFSLRLSMPTGSKRETARHALVVKLNPLDGPVERFKSLLALSKHHRQWRGAETLARHGLAPATPVALLRGRLRLGARQTRCEVLLLPEVSGRTLLEAIASGDADLGTGPDTSLADRLGEDLAKCARAGVWNRDPKPSNVLVREDGGLVWLDTVGVGYRRGADHAFVRHAIKMLLVESRGVGAECPEGFALRALSSAAGVSADRARAMLGEIRAEATAHGDATPADDPLRRSAG
ncbi:MAG: hypothetical protein ACF8Q5_10715 [Phycisphaerales bacterium JB040]